MNGFTLVALIVLAIGIGVAYRAGALHARRASRAMKAERTGTLDVEPIDAAARVKEAGALATRPASPTAESALPQLLAFAEDRHRLHGQLADARAETARYRQIVIDIEHNAPPPLLDAPGTPDDLKAIVGVGPVIERMLYQLGITTYRQIARWSDRDIDEIDGKLPEFPGRIRRDAWVTQARALHASKYGTAP